MSVILRPELNLSDLPTITLTAGVALSKAIEEICQTQAFIKWPNDVFVAGKKVSGILTEIKAQPDAVDFLVLGIGVNVNTPLKALPKEATSLKAVLSLKTDRIVLTKCILENLEKYYNILQKKGFSSIREECITLSTLIGESVELKMQGRTIKGKGIDIDETGALIIKTSSGKLERIFSGDVTLRK